MFGANPFGQPYFGQIYPSYANTPASAADSANAQDLADATVIYLVSASDSALATDTASSIGALGGGGNSSAGGSAHSRNSALQWMKNLINRPNRKTEDEVVFKGPPDATEFWAHVVDFSTFHSQAKSQVIRASGKARSTSRSSSRTLANRMNHASAKNVSRSISYGQSIALRKSSVSDKRQRNKSRSTASAKRYGKTLNSTSSHSRTNTTVIRTGTATKSTGTFISKASCEKQRKAHVASWGAYSRGTVNGHYQMELTDEQQKMLALIMSEKMDSRPTKEERVIVAIATSDLLFDD